MKKLMQTLVLFSLVVPTSAFAAFTDCDIRGGQPISCEGFYEGDAVMDDNGTYRECHFHEGKAVRCEKNFDGRSIVVHEGLYRSCEIADGKIYRCGAWAQGKAPLWKAENGITVSTLPRPHAAAKIEKAKPAPKPVKAAALKSKPKTRTAAARRAALHAS
jgi:hypothetical protein